MKPRLHPILCALSPAAPHPGTCPFAALLVRALRRHLLLLAAAMLVLAAALPAAPAAAQGRSLSWPAIHVDAGLDADGRLHVRERQTILFDGAWNGGERTFALRSGQNLEIHGLERLGADGRPIAMPEGDLDVVGGWERVDRDTVRWRARAESDPEFRDEAHTYVLDYTLAGVLVATGEEDVYRLAHEFGFADRHGSIGELSVELVVDPAWQVVGGASARSGRAAETTAGDAGGPPPRGTYRWTWTDLAPGASPVAELVLRHVGDATPAAVTVPLPRHLHALPYLVAFLVMVGLAAHFLRAAKGSPREHPLPDLATHPSREWLDEHVFSRPPEEIGALWDRGVGPPEVTAMLARMVAEGKLESWTEGSSGLFHKPVLHLRLLVPRRSLPVAEEKLVDGLFVAGDETDTETVRTHYRGKGFDPAGSIRPHLDRRLKKPRKAREIHSPARRWWTPALLLAAVLLAISTLSVDPELVVGALGAAMFCLVAYLPSLGLAHQWRSRVWWSRWAALGFMAPLFAALMLIGAMSLLLSGAGMPNPGLRLLPILCAIALLPVAALSSVLYRAKNGESAKTVHLRRRLHHARELFARELKRETPRLDDDWMPYLFAFGLGSEVEGWAKHWAVAGPDGHDRDHWASSSGGGSSPTWTGGGGSFGGAGATAGWAAAAAGIASGVAAPTSSGGGGGGGGSSGGGGGGGW